MAWIRVVDESQAGKDLIKVYEQIKYKRGKLSNIMMVQSLNPAAMQAHMELYLSIMYQATGLSREEREMIAIVVSKANACEYCINHHSEALNFYWRDRERLETFVKNFKSLELSQRNLNMLNYAEKLTKNPKAMQESDVAMLRSVGFRNEDILDINLIVSYFNFVNRIANGLGIEFSPDEVRGYKY